MNTSGAKGHGWKRKAAIGGAVLTYLVLLTACGQLMGAMRGVHRPPNSEFGMGPRTSANGLYTATLETEAPLRTRRMQTVVLALRTKAGASVAHASIAVGGGMPQHGHGLPTTPKVTQELGEGRYRVEGVKFNMGGWWELKFRIASDAGTDSVTFNLEL
jgi:hypothetical protein